MSHRAALAYHPDLLEYDFGPDHPLRPERITVGLDLLRRLRLWDEARQTIVPVPAEEAELTAVHAPEYVEAVRLGSDHPEARGLGRFGFGRLDNPPFIGMHRASALVAGASVAAIHAIMRGEIDHAFNPAGGLHHALRDRASGFCIYNDPALAAYVAATEYGARVLCIDLDSHHGDGVQWIFYDDPRILTVSFHESGRYLFPGTGGIEETGKGAGAGTAVNIPFMPGTQDNSWLEAVETIVPPLARSFGPDLVISAHGADTHLFDPLTHMALTTAAFESQARLVHSLAHEHTGGRWLALGSGGYDWLRVVPRSWAMVWSEMTGSDLPEEIPADWIERWQPHCREVLPSRFADVPHLSLPLAESDRIEQINAETVAVVMGRVAA